MYVKSTSFKTGLKNIYKKYSRDSSRKDLYNLIKWLKKYTAKVIATSCL